QTLGVYEQVCEVCIRVSIVRLRDVQSSLFILILVCFSEYALTSHMLETIEQEVVVQMMNNKRSATPDSAAAGVIGALFLMGCGSNDDARQDHEPPAAPQKLEAESAQQHEQATGDVPVAELADPDWVEQTAAKHEIPQRAMAAYAGAQLRIG